MHRAPAVSYPVVRSRWHLRCIGALALLVLLGGWAWVVHDGAGDWRHAALAVAALVSLGAALHEWWRAPAGRLRWDGSQWLWDTGMGETPCTVHPGLDLQSVLVLRLSLQEGWRAYRWLEAAAAPESWLALRRAVVSSTMRPPTPLAVDRDAGAGGRP